MLEDHFNTEPGFAEYKHKQKKKIVFSCMYSDYVGKAFFLTALAQH